jgi:hypothetical protein
LEISAATVLTAYLSTGEQWRSSTTSSEFNTAVRSTLVQPGFPFGSGTRTCWFAPDQGLVKLVFQHGDKSVSTVVLLR